MLKVENQELLRKKKYEVGIAHMGEILLRSLPSKILVRFRILNKSTRAIGYITHYLSYISIIFYRLLIKMK